MENNIQDIIFDSILEGDSAAAKAGVEQALAAGLDPTVILNEGMTRAGVAGSALIVLGIIVSQI